MGLGKERSWQTSRLNMTPGSDASVVFVQLRLTGRNPAGLVLAFGSANTHSRELEGLCYGNTHNLKNKQKKKSACGVCMSSIKSLFLTTIWVCFYKAAIVTHTNGTEPCQCVRFAWVPVRTKKSEWFLLVLLFLVLLLLLFFLSRVGTAIRPEHTSPDTLILCQTRTAELFRLVVATGCSDWNSNRLSQTVCV